MAKENLEVAYKLDIHHSGDKRVRQTWISFLERCWEAGLLETEPKAAPADNDRVQEPDENIPGVEVEEAIESKIEPAAFRELTFSEALKICRSISEALPTKNLKELQMLRLKVLDLTARPGSNCFHGHSKHKSSWIAEIRSELTYLLEIRAIAFPPPIGLGRSVAPGCLGRSWDIPATENSPGVETQAPDRWAKPDRWNPADFGQVLHAADALGQLNLLEWDVSEPPDPDDYPLLTDFHDAYDRWLLEEQVREVFEKSDANNASTTRTGTEQAGANEIAIATELPSGCDDSAKLHGTSGHHQNEGLGSQKGDRLLEASGAGSGDTGRVLSHQSSELVPQATFNDEQPPNRGDERSRITSAQPTPPHHLKPGTTVGHKSGAHLGEIAKIYYSGKRRKWRAKVGAANYDLDNLVEQKVLSWDFPKPLGNWIETGTMMLHSDACTIWTRKLPPTQKPLENWTLAELTAKPIWQLKAIAKRCCQIIPGGHPRTKRAYIRAILAEQELRAIAREKDAPKPLVDRAARTQIKPAAKKQAAKKRGETVPEPLGQQLSLNLFSAAS